MWLAMFCSLLAFAEPTPEESNLPMGLIIVDARMPAEVRINGQRLFEILVPGRAEVPFPAGSYEVSVWTGGDPTALPITVPLKGNATVMVGRTGISVRASDGTNSLDAPAAPSSTEPAKVSIRLVGLEQASVHIDGQRHFVQLGDEPELSLTPGRHTMQVRNGSGTVIWASGSLNINGKGPLTMQVSEGRAPEVSGGGTFSMGS